MKTECIEPGLVRIQGFLSPEQQKEIATIIMERGAEEQHGGFWKQKRDGTMALSATKTRGRIYQSLEWYGEKDKLKDICCRATQVAGDEDDTIPNIEPTHLLSLYYATKYGIKWHVDDGENDGTADCPVVSFSLGNACDFAIKRKKEDEPRKIRLESGDVIIFGGPSRMIVHAVTTIYQETCPLHLQEVLGDARMNLTFREAPEVAGREEQFQDFRKALSHKRKHDAAN